MKVTKIIESESPRPLEDEPYDNRIIGTSNMNIETARGPLDPDDEEF